MKTKILEPIDVSNYYLGNIKNHSKYLSKFGGSGYFNETEKFDVYGTMFNFLVFEEGEEGEPATMGRFVVKISSLDQLLFLNKMFTYSNKKFFFSNNKTGIGKMLKTSGYIVGILSRDDLKLFEQQGIEIYQGNSNLFQSIVNKPINTIQTDYKKIIFINEYLFSLYYFSVIKGLFKKKELKSSSKTYKFINNDILFYESFFKKEMKELIQSDNITFLNSLFLEITDEENQDILNYSYFLKLGGYFSYFDDFKKELEDNEKKDLYKSIGLLSSMFFKENTEKNISLNNKIELFIKKLNEGDEEFIKTFNELYQSSKEISMKEFFYGDQDEKKIKYEHNLFKPEYGFQGLTDFLFKK